MKWNKGALDDIVEGFTEGAKNLVKTELDKRFKRQIGADNKRFPSKVKGKYLGNTGQMVSSLKVRVTRNLVEGSLQNKDDIYENYLEYKTEGLTLDDELLDKIMANGQRNLKKKGF